MTADELYFTVMLAASSCMVLTGLVLAAVKTRYDEVRAKFRMAKAWMTLAVLAIGGFNIIQIIIDPDGDWNYLTGCITLVISYLQAMLLTMVVLVFISPSEVTQRLVVKQLVVITVMSAVLMSSLFLLPTHVFLFIYWIGIAVYIAMLVVYTRWYLRCYRRFRQQIADYYEDEEIEHGLRWLSTIFWVGLAVGVLALLMLLGRRNIDVCLTVAFAVFYAFMTSCFINYELSTPIILPALAAASSFPETSGYATPKESECAIQLQTADAKPESNGKLESWIRRGGYIDTQKAVSDIVRELDMTTEQFHQYFIDIAGEDFRTWRVRKRVEHARLMMEEHPDWPVIRVAMVSGFNDRSWFYKQFIQYSGLSVADFRKSLRPNAGSYF